MLARASFREMNGIARTLIGLGIALVVVGLLFWAFERLGLGRLPGDFVWKRRNVTVHLPIATSLLISVVLTVLLNLWLGRK